MRAGSARAEWTIDVVPGGGSGGREDGSVEHPVRSLAAARDLARSSGRLGKEPVVVRLRAGVHYLTETLVLGPEDSGSAEAPVRWVGEEGTVVSGAVPVAVRWEPWRDGIFRARLTADQRETLGSEGTDQLIVGGRRQPMARFPNIVPGKNVYDAWDLAHGVEADPAGDALSPARVARWADPTGAYVHAMHALLWGDMHYRVTGKRPDGTLEMEGGWQNNRASSMHGTFRYVENVLEELDAPGEWFFDRKTSTLYFMPPAGEGLPDRVEFVRLRHLVELRGMGTGGSAVRHVALSGIAFRHACRTFMDNREPLLRSDWTTYRGGAVFVSGVEDVTLEGCTFEHLGGNAVFVSGYARRFAVRSSLLREIGANGIAFVGSAEAVRSPLFNYDEAVTDFGAVDRTPGPRSADFPKDCVVEDCLITRTGRDEKQTAPVQISMSQGITVRHCSIYGVPRAGINISEGTWGGHVVEYCDVFDTVLETTDHGSFNAWGRDRYWAPPREVVDERVAKEPGLPFLDAMEPVVLRYNRWRCDHGWDVDLDDGSTNYQIHGNLMLVGGLKLREGYRRIVENNVLLNDTLHPHVWFENSGDVFRFNIVMGEYRPAGGMPTNRWGAEVDRNYFLAHDDARERFGVAACDLNSRNSPNPGEVKFLDAPGGDFRVAADSAARKVGFTGWDFGPETYGVRSARLRAVARTPVIPALRDPSREASVVKRPLVYEWGATRIRDFSGQEFSAYGTSRECPGVLVTWVDRHEKTIARDDVIMEVNGAAVGSVADLIGAVEAGRAMASRPWGVKVVALRNQRRVSLTLDAAMPPPRL